MRGGSAPRGADLPHDQNRQARWHEDVDDQPCPGCHQRYGVGRRQVKPIEVQQGCDRSSQWAGRRTRPHGPVPRGAGALLETPEARWRNRLRPGRCGDRRGNGPGEEPIRVLGQQEELDPGGEHEERIDLKPAPRAGCEVAQAVWCRPGISELQARHTVLGACPLRAGAASIGCPATRWPPPQHGELTLILAWADTSLGRAGSPT